MKLIYSMSQSPSTPHNRVHSTLFIHLATEGKLESFPSLRNLAVARTKLNVPNNLQDAMSLSLGLTNRTFLRSDRGKGRMISWTTSTGMLEKAVGSLAVEIVSVMLTTVECFFNDSRMLWSPRHGLIGRCERKK